MGGRAAVKMPTLCEPSLHRVHRGQRLQFHACLRQALTKPTAGCPCGRQTTIIHPLEALASPFWGCHLYWAGHRGIFFVDISLEPWFGNLGSASKASQRKTLPSPAVKQGSWGWVVHFLRRLFEALSAAVVPFEPLFTLGATSVLDRFGAGSKGTRGHGRSTAKTLLPYHYILSTTDDCFTAANLRCR
jgi:hypothetical protein